MTLLSSILAVFKTLGKVKCYAAGPDNIPDIPLNRHAGPLIRFLTMLFQQSLYQNMLFLLRRWPRSL